MRERSAPAAVSNQRVKPMASVAMITAVALVGVGVLAVQANGSAPKVANNSAQQAHPAPPQTTVSASPGATQPAPAPDPLALPADSGSGKRVVYSLKGNRIWLVDASNKVQRTAPVVPGTVQPKPGDYKVTSWTSGSKGGDGTQVQYVVLFGASPEGTSFGFDAVYGVSGMPPAPTGKTGGIRMSQEDALAVWEFATNSKGTAVKVVAG